MSRARTRRAQRVARFPRVSGDEPDEKNVDARRLSFSPCERG